MKLKDFVKLIWDWFIFLSVPSVELILGFALLKAMYQQSGLDGALIFLFFVLIPVIYIWIKKFYNDLGERTEEFFGEIWDEISKLI